MILDVLRRFFVRVEPRTPPRGVETAANLGDIGDIFLADAARLAADYERRQRGGVSLVGAGHSFTVPRHLE
jgi:hypothetical protein